eukprot:TRINITY_DN2003_c0_g1_i3.p1 TRINITY_DN2003_c0_g1~~TRINITY_DN2003_c0_g1_i3.p1  ORF type:complete len:268 (+),score=64.32 TRINITY_DN2003_c0_g1_i3:106-909(+)
MSRLLLILVVFCVAGFLIQGSLAVNKHKKKGHALKYHDEASDEASDDVDNIHDQNDDLFKEIDEYLDKEDHKHHKTTHHLSHCQHHHQAKPLKHHQHNVKFFKRPTHAANSAARSTHKHVPKRGKSKQSRVDELLSEGRTWLTAAKQFGEKYELLKRDVSRLATKRDNLADTIKKNREDAEKWKRTKPNDSERILNLVKKHEAELKEIERDLRAKVGHMERVYNQALEACQKAKSIASELQGIMAVLGEKTSAARSLIDQINSLRLC